MEELGVTRDEHEDYQGVLTHIVGPAHVLSVFPYPWTSFTRVIRLNLTFRDRRRLHDMPIQVALVTVGVGAVVEI